MDWDKLRVFQAAADAGSFTHAGETLGLSQSAVSRQVGALEADLGAPLFHRHARDSSSPSKAKCCSAPCATWFSSSTPCAAGSSTAARSRTANCGSRQLLASAPIGWRRGSASSSISTPRSSCNYLLSDDDLDLGMREADVALRLREPSQPDLIRRRLFTVHFHAYASAEYLRKHPQPRKVEDLDQHHLVAFGAPTATHLLYDLNSLLSLGRDPKNSACAANHDQQFGGDDARGRAQRRHRRVARLLRAARIRGSCGCCRRRTCRRWTAFWCIPRSSRTSRGFMPFAIFSSARRSAGATEAGEDGRARAVRPQNSRSFQVFGVFSFMISRSM